MLEQIKVSADPNSDIPYGTELFVIVPDRCAGLPKEQLYASLAREFPQFKFTLGRPVDGGDDGFMVMAVAGTTGEGWQPAKPLVHLDRATQEAVAHHIEAFAAHKAGKSH